MSCLQQDSIEIRESGEPRGLPKSSKLRKEWKLKNLTADDADSADPV